MNSTRWTRWRLREYLHAGRTAARGFGEYFNKRNYSVSDDEDDPRHRSRRPAINADANTFPGNPIFRKNHANSKMWDPF